MNKRLWVTLSIALLGASAQAAVSPGQVEKIEILIEEGNWVELRAFLTRNPHLLVGENALAEELRQFMKDTENLFTALVFEDSLFPDLSNLDLERLKAEEAQRVRALQREQRERAVRRAADQIARGKAAEPAVKTTTVTRIGIRDAGSASREGDDFDGNPLDDDFLALNSFVTGPQQISRLSPSEAQDDSLDDPLGAGGSDSIY